MRIERRTVQLPDGRSTAVHEIDAAPFLRVTVADLGATLLRIEAPDRTGRLGDVLLGAPDPGLYPTGGAPGSHHYFGATCGRFANRIGGARFTLDGREHQLSMNDPPNCLHGGAVGFDRAIWQSEPLPDGVQLRHQSPAGDQGFPGALGVVAEFRVDADGVLAIRYEARTDAPTHVNLVSHGYFNLEGTGSIAEHRLQVAAGRYLPIEAHGLPDGPPRHVANTPFDFRRARRIGDGIDAEDPQIRLGDGYNHCLVLDAPGLDGPPAACLSSSASGRALRIWTTAPGLHLYSANALDGSMSPAFARRTALCLEAEDLPDSPNRPDFPSTRLDPGQLYVSETRLAFGVA